MLQPGYSREVLVAEHFVLLALDPDGSPARGHGNQTAVKIGVTGALIIELMQQGHLALDDGRIRQTGTLPNHPLLAQTLDNVGQFEGKKLKTRIGRVKHCGWSEVVDMMIGDGVLGRVKTALHPTDHPVLRPEVRQDLLDRVRAAAIGDGPLDDRTAALLALAGPSRLLEVVAPDRADRKKAKRRIAEAADRVPAAAAVKYAIEAATTSVFVAAT